MVIVLSLFHPNQASNKTSQATKPAKQQNQPTGKQITKFFLVAAPLRSLPLV
jgi:hypothetical protein